MGFAQAVPSTADDGSAVCVLISIAWARSCDRAPRAPQPVPNAALSGDGVHGLTASGSHASTILERHAVDRGNLSPLGIGNLVDEQGFHAVRYALGEI